MTTWMMVLALAATDGAHARERLAAPAVAQVQVVQHDPAPHTPAEASQWTYLGPEEASLSALAVSPTNPDYLLATNAPMWNIVLQSRTMQTHSAGLEWSPVAPLREVRGDIAFMADGRAVVAGMQGLYSQAPGASTWTHHLHPGSGSTFQVAHLAMGGPGGPVWAAGRVSESGQVFRIDDLGTSWVEVTPPLPADTHLLGLAASATQPGVAAVAFSEWFGAIRTMVTTDGGMSWYENEAHAGWLRTINVFEVHGDRLFLGVTTSGGFSGLLVGDALGASWQVSYQSGAVVDLAVDASDISRLWIATPSGVRHSTDGGASWQQGSHQIFGRRSTQVAYDSASARLWVALDWYGVWMSDDGGADFERRSHRLNTMPSAMVALNPWNPAHIAVVLQSELGVGRTLATSTDGGLRWPLTLDQPSGNSAGRPYFDADGTQYAAFGETTATRLRRRAPGGPWQFAHPSSGPAGATDIVPAGEPAALVMATRRHNFFLSGYEAALHRFDEGDMAWARVVEGTFDSRGFTLTRIDAAGDLRLLAHEVVDPGKGFGRMLGSDDDGRTWVELHQGLGAWNEGAMCTGDDGLVMLVVEKAGRSWLYRSENAGDNWARTAWNASGLQEAGAPFQSLHCPGDGQQVFMGDRRGNLWWSTDAGNSFTTRAADADTWGLVDIRDIQSSIVGMYVANKNGLWVNTALARPSHPPVELGVSIAAGRMRTLATLNWDAGLSRVEIRRNGAVVAEVDNTGTYIDAMLTPLRPATLQWQVCNAGTWECSEPVSD